MAKQSQLQLWFWLGVTLATIFLIWLFEPILLPFITGIIIAYLLDPIVDWFETKSMPRSIAALLVIVTFSAILIILLLAVIPAIVSQLIDLFDHIPDLINAARNAIENYGGQVLAMLPDWLQPTSQQTADSTKNFLTGVTGFIASLLSSLLTRGIALFNLVSLIIITPVVAFYILVDWDKMINNIRSYIPPKHLTTVGGIANDINRVIAGFIRGQLIVCLIMASFYGISLNIIGLNFALLIGFISGVIGFIPYVGSITGFVLAIGVTLYQFWPDWFMLAVVIAVFIAGQFIEGNILQPKIIGNRIGLHPVWLMFSLFAFGYLFGFVGLLIAVPAAAAIAVIIRFGLQSYRNSNYYKI